MDQPLSHVWLFPAPWTVAYQASLSFTISWSLLRFIFIELVMLSNHFILCCLLLLLASIFPGIKVFSNESVLPIRWLKYWSFRFSISPFNEYSGLISFRTDWFDLLAVNYCMQVNKMQSQDRARTRQTNLMGIEVKELEEELVKNVKAAPVDIWCVGLNCIYTLSLETAAHLSFQK